MHEHVAPLDPVVEEKLRKAGINPNSRWIEYMRTGISAESRHALTQEGIDAFISIYKRDSQQENN